MKTLATYLFCLITISILTSGCSTNEESKNKIVHHKSCTIAIEGMMCEKGCKTTIQNKLREMEGVIQADVDFEVHQAFITYDANKVSAQDFIDRINKIADGLYKATLVEDKDIENAPTEIEHGDSNQSVSVKDFHLELPDFSYFFNDLIYA